MYVEAFFRWFYAQNNVLSFVVYVSAVAARLSESPAKTRKIGVLLYQPNPNNLSCFRFTKGQG
jgi:hypothetical protein